MALSDSMFLFEIILEKVNTFVTSKQFTIKSQFADIFSIDLKDPEDNAVIVPKRRRKSKRKVKHVKEAVVKNEEKQTAEASQSILFASNVDLLMSHMLQYPMEITLWSKENPEVKIGSTEIPWNPAFVQFLARLYKGEQPAPVLVEDLHNVFDEYTSRRMASIKLLIKLSYIKQRISTHFRGRSQEKANTITKSTRQAVTNAEKRPIPEVAEEMAGTIKTIYSGGKTKKKNPNKRNPKKKKKEDINNRTQNSDQNELTKEISNTKANTLNTNNPVDKSLFSLVKSEADITQLKERKFSKSKSCSSMKRLNTLNYIFGDQRGPFGNRIYTVGYFTVQNPPSNPSSQEKLSNKSSNKSTDKSQISSRPSPTALKPLAKTSTKKSPELRSSPRQQISETALSNLRYKFELCTKECPNKSTRLSLSEYSIDLPKEAEHLITVTKCKDERCVIKKDRDPLEPPDHRILIGMSTRENPCCITETKQVVGEVVGSMAASFMLGQDPCYCACECVFDVNKTTYCKICGGYEIAGDDTVGKPPYLMPIPCPEYHHLTEKNKAKTGSTSGSESKKKYGKNEFDKDSKKGKKKRKDDRFKFNYGYKAPQIGHSQCGMPCTGNLNNVPKSMGWLWTSDNVPGMKFRPQWKPGAVSKFVLRLLKMARNPGEVAKKRKKETGKKKRPLKRPLLVVHKKDGEYSVTMETMKTYTKPRALNQQPYEDKPVITYTIGRTEEENRERRKKKERAQRRLEREQRAFIQSAFRDMCQEICLKTYQQALELLPDAEDPKCACYPALPGPEQTNLERSCSCSEDSASLASDTDSDEWIVEFTPPNAHFDPTYKGKKIFKVDNETQYSYLDYRVKLLDRFGNQVPRFFKGIDGKQLCSDLGGFWNADHQWQEINVDGIIGPDGRWAPMAFSGPNGEQVDIDNTGKFQAMNGNWLVVGVDGFIDSHCKWRFYPKSREVPVKKKRTLGVQKGAGDRTAKKAEGSEKSEPWSCFGDISPIELGKMGIVGHGADKKLLYKTLQDLIARGEKDVKIPQVPRVPRSPTRRRERQAGLGQYFDERVKCHHPVPSDKGIVKDAYGHRSYFKSKLWRNRRPEERLHYLDSQGKSVSTFHEPCFHSFIDGETMKQQLRERLMRRAGCVTEYSQTDPSRRGAGYYKYGSHQAGKLAHTVTSQYIK